ncbi:Cu_bind_like domain-containing protein [Cephalotus follicularis]|uniref:Cu_bind_like domain-containing protein n=1 Tax=Cephalotus follicularis TaxID=3775 RepID=A0A1Q3CYH0_CEPFO|nr:Cu_bind_like domain-containing protein [Cephalotus follicularis]
MFTPALLNLTVIMLLITVAASATTYNNHTVGGGSGWIFNSSTNTSATNYTAWAASQTFNLGDYLIFNTNSNETVIQTYNVTTFDNCTMDDSSDNDTFQYDGGETEFNQPSTIAVPLTIVGANYFFSDADDGTQCLQGMAFEIQVNHGLGLPPSLNQPPPPPYIEPPGPDSVQSPPIAGGSQPPPGNGAMGSGASLQMVMCVFLVVVLALL